MGSFSIVTLTLPRDIIAPIWDLGVKIWQIHENMPKYKAITQRTTRSSPGCWGNSTAIVVFLAAIPMCLGPARINSGLATALVVGKER